MDNGRCRVQGAIKHIKYSEGANAAPGASEKEKHNNICYPNFRIWSFIERNWFQKFSSAAQKRRLMKNWPPRYVSMNRKEHARLKNNRRLMQLLRNFPKQS